MLDRLVEKYWRPSDCSRRTTDYEYELSVLSTRLRFGGRKISKCACLELKTRTRSRSRTPIWRSLLSVVGGRRICKYCKCPGVRQGHPSVLLGFSVVSGIAPVTQARACKASYFHRAKYEERAKIQKHHRSTCYVSSFVSICTMIYLRIILRKRAGYEVIDKERGS